MTDLSFIAAILVALALGALGYRARSPELRYIFYAVGALILTMGIPGGRVLVLPVIFALMLALLYWLARPVEQQGAER